VKELVKEDIERRKSDRIQHIGDKLRHTAYRGVGLGRSPVCPEYNLNQIYPDTLAEYILGNVNGNNIKLQLVGSFPEETDGILREILQSYAAIPSGSSESANSKPENTYSGGDLLESGGPTNIYVEAYKGVARDNKDFPAQMVLASILGDASSGFNLPGNLVNARLAKAFSDGVDQANSFICYDSSTLFGVRAIGKNSTKSLAETVHQQLADLGTSKISQSELDRAKVAVKNKLKFANDSRAGFYHLSAISGNDRNTFYDTLDSVTAEGLQKVAQTIFSSPRTTVVVGDLSNIPSFAKY